LQAINLRAINSQNPLQIAACHLKARRPVTNMRHEEAKQRMFCGLCRFIKICLSASPQAKTATGKHEEIRFAENGVFSCAQDSLKRF